VFLAGQHDLDARELAARDELDLFAVVKSPVTSTSLRSHAWIVLEPEVFRNLDLPLRVGRSALVDIVRGCRRREAHTGGRDQRKQCAPVRTQADAGFNRHKLMPSSSAGLPFPLGPASWFTLASTASSSWYVVNNNSSSSGSPGCVASARLISSAARPSSRQVLLDFLPCGRGSRPGRRQHRRKMQRAARYPVERMRRSDAARRAAGCIVMPPGGAGNRQPTRLLMDPPRGQQRRRDHE
jgi:hypothetical protein